MSPHTPTGSLRMKLSRWLGADAVTSPRIIRAAAGIELDPIDGRRDLALADVADRLAHLDRDQAGQRLGLLAQQAGELHQDRRRARGRRSPARRRRRRSRRAAAIAASRSSTPDSGAIATRSPVAGSRLSMRRAGGGRRPAAVDVVGDGDHGGSGLGHRVPRMAVDGQVERGLEEVLLDGQGRAELDDVLERAADAEDDAALEGGARGSRPCGPRRAPASRGRSRSRCRRTGRVRGPRRRSARPPGRPAGARASRRRVAPTVRPGARRRRTPIAAEPAARWTALAMNVEVCVPGVQCDMNAARPSDRRDGQPAADPLADRHQVRHDVPVLGTPRSARSDRSRTGPRRR